MAEEQPTDEIAVKLRPGYTFHHPDTGVALQHSLPDKETGKSEVVAINKDGGREDMPGPFFLLSEKAMKGQTAKFERPTEEELEMLKGANSQEVKIKVAPKPTPMKALSVQKEVPPPENKMVETSPEKKDDKKGKKKASKKKFGEKIAKALKKTS